MAKRKIVWTQTAVAQRRHILKYWIEHNQSTTYSEKLVELFRERSRQLIERPKLGKKADFPETRVVSMGHFSIFYKVTKVNIIITSLWDNRQDPAKLLKLLENGS
jgi:plasmid stabilization system protein ParE